MTQISVSSNCPAARRDFWWFGVAPPAVTSRDTAMLRGRAAARVLALAVALGRADGTVDDFSSSHDTSASACAARCGHGAWGAHPGGQAHAPRRGPCVQPYQHQHQHQQLQLAAVITFTVTAVRLQL